MSAVEDLPPDERRAYELISEEGELLQSELWKTMDASSRKGSRLAQSLADDGLIEREEVVHDGQVTYLLRPAEDTDGENGGEGVSGSGAAPATGADEGTDLSMRERRALSLIEDRNGLYQSELWKELDVSSRTGSRIASTLAEAGVIEREETTHGGRKTYYLSPVSEDWDFSLLMAGDMISPLTGAEGEVDPITSDEFTEWVLNLAQEGPR